MKSVIYYFSGTGNSLDIARKISTTLEAPTEIISIAHLYKAPDIQEHSDIVGFVFPNYLGDAPWLVKEFVKKLNFSNTPYIYAVTTCNGHPKDCLAIFQALLKTCSQTLAFAEVVLMPGNAKISSPEVNTKRLSASAETCLAIANKVNARVTEAITASQKLSERKILGSPRKKLDIVFSHFRVSAACNKCGTCRKICPMCNIKLQNGRPMWGNECATCLACFHWCPKNAITFWFPILGKRPRYRHPDISLKDMTMVASVTKTPDR